MNKNYNLLIWGWSFQKCGTCTFLAKHSKRPDSELNLGNMTSLSMLFVPKSKIWLLLLIIMINGNCMEFGHFIQLPNYGICVFRRFCYWMPRNGLKRIELTAKIYTFLKTYFIVYGYKLPIYFSWLQASLTSVANEQASRKLWRGRCYLLFGNM